MTQSNIAAVTRLLRPDLARRPDYCPLIGHNPGWLLPTLLDITP